MATAERWTIENGKLIQKKEAFRKSTTAAAASKTTANRVNSSRTPARQNEGGPLQTIDEVMLAGLVK